MEGHGLVSFIIHPDYTREGAALEVYRNLLRYLSDLRDAGRLWIALPQEVNRWWRERSQMRLVYGDDKWHIEGNEKGQARVAYAVLAGDDIHYTFDPSA